MARSRAPQQATTVFSAWCSFVTGHPCAIVLVLLLFCAGAAPAAAPLQESFAGMPIAAPEEVGMSSERLGRLSNVMQGFVDRREVPGVLTLVARRGKIVHLEALGMRDIESSAPMTVDTIFRIASMTKPIVSIALMTLYEGGHFQLRDPISNWLPEYRDMRVAVPVSSEEGRTGPYKTIPAVRAITLQHLLTHTAGLANSYKGLTSAEYGELRQQRRPGMTVGDFVSSLADLPLNFEPGDAWEYGPATDVVGRLVEVMSGQTLDEFLAERVFTQLEMPDTHFYLPESKLGRFAAAYRPDDDGKIQLTEAPTAESSFVREPHTYFSGGGGLVSTISDYVRFQQMMLNGGELDGARILGRKTVELITANHIGARQPWLTGPGYGFGLGYAVKTDLGASASPHSVGTFAWGGAYCTYFWVDPAEELIGIVMTQVRPYTHLSILADFGVLTYQAIVD